MEVLVINNGSTDGTRLVIRGFPGVHYLPEPAPGLSRARNADLVAARAELVAYLDDDARAEPGWADALINAAHRWPQAAA